MTLLFALAIPMVAGAVVFRYVWPIASGLPSGLMTFRYALAAALGLGLSSCLYFWAYALAGRPGDGFVVLEIIAFAGCTFAAYRGRSTIETTVALPPPKSDRIGRWLWIGFAVAVLVAINYTYAESNREPHGFIDAIGIWNLRARFLDRTTEGWGDTFSPLIWHTDYPLLVPTQVARCWLYLGEESTAAPALVGMVYAGLTAAILIGGLNALRGGGQGWLAGIVLLCSPEYVFNIGWQGADIPFGCYTLATAVAFVIHDASNQRAGSISDGPGVQSRLLPMTAGAAVGLAAWTKNEGLVLVVAVVIVRGLTARGRPRAEVMREWTSFALGLVPAALTLLYFKLALAPPNDLIAGQGSSTFDRITDLNRHEEILRGIGRDVWKFGAGPLLGLVAYAIIVRFTPKRVPGTATPLALLAIMVASYYAAYLVTPHDVKWHVESSLPRLLSQLWPLALFAFFLSVGTLDESAGKNPAASAPPAKQKS